MSHVSVMRRQQLVHRAAPKRQNELGDFPFIRFIRGKYCAFFKHAFFFFKINLFIYFWLRWVFVAARGLFSSCRKQGLLFVAVRGLVIAVAFLVAEHGP